MLRAVAAAGAAFLTLCASGAARAATFDLPLKGSTLFLIGGPTAATNIQYSISWNRAFNVAVDGLPGYETIADFGYGYDLSCNGIGGSCEVTGPGWDKDRILMSSSLTPNGLLLRVRTVLNDYDFCDTGSLTSTCMIDYKFNSLTIDGNAVVLKTSAVPEPTTWAMMIAGFGMIGGALRRYRNVEVRKRGAAA